jgi:hypothetical protein
MLNFKVKILFMTVVLFLVAVSGVNAQFAGGAGLKVNIPVSFIVR